MSEELRTQIERIVEGAMNSAIPEPWEVQRHAVDRILSLIAAAPSPPDGAGVDHSGEPSNTVLSGNAQPLTQQGGDHDR